MKKTILVMATAISLFACSTPEAKTAGSDDAAMTAFKENAKIVESGLMAFAKNDLAEFATYVSDTAKFYGPGFNDTVAYSKTEWIKRLESFHTILTDIKANIVGSYPGLDSVTYKPDGGVRTYVMWESVSKVNGHKYNNKFYSVFRFNADHKIVEENQFFDATGIVTDAMAPKK
jgi:ketosteroid isomerase-like protein